MQDNLTYPRGISSWRRARPSRRAVLRGGLLGATGLAGAALLGCSDPDETSDGASGSEGSGTGVSGNGSGGGTASSVTLERAPGYPGEDFGKAPVNEKARIMGGELRLFGTSLFDARQNDPDRNNAGGLTEWNNDRLTIPKGGGWTTEVVYDMLASSEAVDETKLVLTIRPGIKTHNRPPLNGRIFTAEDVAYSINRKAGKLDPVAAEAYSRAVQFTGLNRAEAVDDVTVELTFDSPNGSVLPALADMRASMIPIEADEIGYSDPMQIPGTGAWILESNEPDVRSVLRANPDYYRSDEEGGRPSFDTVNIAAYPDRAAQVAAFLTGDLDQLTAVLPHEDAQITASRSDALRYSSPSAAWEHFQINPARVPAFQDKRMQKALQLSIDYAGTMDPLSSAGWFYSPPLHAMYPESWSQDQVKALPGYNPDTKEADIAEAKKLAAAAGYEDGNGISWTNTQYSTTSNFFQTAVRLQEQWSRIFPGMSIEFQQLPDFATYTNVKATREFDGTNYNFASVPDIALDAMTYYHSTGTRNYASYNEPWADDLIEKGFQSMDSEERRELFGQFMQRYVEEGGPTIALGVLFTDHAYSPTVGGADLFSGTWHFFYGSTYGGNARWLWRTE